MKALRFCALLLGAAVLALLWVELGLRGAALAWRQASRAFSRPGPYTVYVVGESTAYGEPYAPRLSFPRILALMFGERLRGRPLELVILARPGSTTEAQYWLLLRELALRPRRDGAVLVYAGINESSPEAAPGAAALLADRSLLVSRLAALRRARAGGPGQGLDFESRLAKIARLARACGHPVVLGTLAGNLRDFQPDVSRGLRDDPGLSARYEKALADESAGRWREAAEAYRELEGGGPGDPGLEHRRARCLLELGRTAEARELFQKAADQGGSKRPTTAQDLAIRRLAARFGTGLADARADFAAAAAHGLPGYDLFWDAHHPNLRGYLVLASSFARELSRVLGEPLARPDLGEAEARADAGFAKGEEKGIFTSRFLWFCGETWRRVDRREPLRMARRYLGQAEAAGARPLPAYRLLLALVARDRAGVERVLKGRDGGLRRDREALGAIGCNPDWTGELVRSAGLPEPLRAEAQAVMGLAAKLSKCGQGGGPGGARAPSPQRRRYLASKKRADRGVALVLSGKGDEGLRELEAALLIHPENAEAAASLCTWHSRLEAWERAWPYCDLAWRAAQSGEEGHPEAFIDQCRDARERVKARLKTQNPPLGGSRS